MSATLPLDSQSTALLALGHALQRADYRFVTVTPATHARVLQRDAARGNAEAQTVRDVFGWNKRFRPELLASEMLDCMQRAGALEPDGSLLRAAVRFSTLGDRLFVHSPFPTAAEDAVFFGPDTYRFCAYVRRAAQAAHRIADVGCGTGAGGISLAGKPQRLVLSDINQRALRFAQVNVALAGVQAEVVQSDLLRDVTGEFDLIVANPPYMQDSDERTYRHGGGAFGEGLSARIVAECLPRLTDGGSLLLYTGAPVVEGIDRFEASLRPALTEFESAGRRQLTTVYEELDPDVFGEELSLPAYAKVERIAAVGLMVRVSAR